MNEVAGLQFIKMHGLGNDIMIVDCLKHPYAFDTALIQRLADRHSGIGFDQLITIELSNQEADFFCRIYNPDGSEAEQCGNGLRCVARYLHEEALHQKSSLTIQTVAGNFPIVIHDYSAIAVTMNSPIIIDASLLLALPNDNAVEVMSLQLGNPHAIMRVPDISHFPIATLGPLLSAHAHFLNGANIGFMQVANQHEATLRTYERGAGLTLACGSNAAAAAIVGITKGWLSSPVTIQFERGNLIITWDGLNTVIMQGPAEVCYSGQLK